MNDSEPVKLASLLLAAAFTLLEVTEQPLVLWESDSAMFGQRCVACGLWISVGEAIRSTCNVTRSRQLGQVVGDYTHVECPRSPLA